MSFLPGTLEVSPLLPLGVAFGLSFLCSMGGVSGAILLLPLQICLFGNAGPSVSATNQLFNLVATPSGVWRYLREGRMVWPLALTLCSGTLPGLVLGVWIRVVFLPDPKAFLPFASAVLLLVAWNMVRALRRGGKKSKGAGGSFTVKIHSFSVRGLAYDFNGTHYAVSTAGLFSMALVVGVIGGAYGIGGGAIISPFLVSFFRLPVHSISGATLFSTFFTALSALVLFSVMAPFYPELSVAPNWTLGLLLGLGGMAGMYCGAAMQRHVPALQLNRLLIALLVCASLILLGRAVL